MTGPSPAGIYPNEPIRQIVRIKDVITRQCVLAGAHPLRRYKRRGKI